jgi:hypothetical protein
MSVLTLLEIDKLLTGRLQDPFGSKRAEWLKQYMLAMVIEPPSKRLLALREEKANGDGDWDTRYQKACEILRSRESVVWFGEARCAVCLHHYPDRRKTPCVQIPGHKKCAVSLLGYAWARHGYGLGHDSSDEYKGIWTSDRNDPLPEAIRSTAPRIPLPEINIDLREKIRCSVDIAWTYISSAVVTQGRYGIRSALQAQAETALANFGPRLHAVKEWIPRYARATRGCEAGGAFSQDYTDFCQEISGIDYACRCLTQIMEDFGKFRVMKEKESEAQRKPPNKRPLAQRLAEKVSELEALHKTNETLHETVASQAKKIEEHQKANDELTAARDSQAEALRVIREEMASQTEQLREAREEIGSQAEALRLARDASSLYKARKRLARQDERLAKQDEILAHFHATLVKHAEDEEANSDSDETDDATTGGQGVTTRASKRQRLQ